MRSDLWSDNGTPAQTRTPPVGPTSGRTPLSRASPDLWSDNLPHAQTGGAPTPARGTTPLTVSESYSGIPANRVIRLGLAMSSSMIFRSGREVKWGCRAGTWLSLGFAEAAIPVRRRRTQGPMPCRPFLALRRDKAGFGDPAPQSNAAFALLLSWVEQ